ncbi:MAG: ATP-binding cassette domain-containing protein [Tissierellia bacterium]|nr:ATP-binding cassette domain-containing protein [Tissierellia bacterium]
MSMKIDLNRKIGGFQLDLSFISSKRIVSVLGASGSGKSMTLKCVSGLVKPDRGVVHVDDSIYFDSEKGINLPTRERRIGFLFQNYALFPHMSAIENIKFGIREGKHKEQIAERMLKDFYLEDLGDRYPSQLSGGQKQRVALARILATDPSLILLDEPFSALDGALRRRMEDEIIGKIREFDIPILFVSHDRNETYRISEDVLILNHGQMEVFGDKEEVFHRPKTLAAARIVGFENDSALEKWEENKCYAADYGLWLNLPKRSGRDAGHIAFRAQDLRLKPPSGDNALEVIHVNREIHGATALLSAENSKKSLRIELPESAAIPKLGEIVGIELSPEKIAMLK